jgi:hypothetical protein
MTPTGNGKCALPVRIEGVSLPGRVFCEHRHVHVGVQCRQEPVMLVPGDADAAEFDFTVDILPAAGGGWDFRGPYVHGKPGERFLYLTWGELNGDEFAMFRRAKLMLADVPVADEVVADVDLTDEQGLPCCARLHDPVIRWRTAVG